MSSASLVVDDQEEIIRGLIDAERKSPSVYEPARNCFLAILSGNLTFDDARYQAQAVVDQIERKCALEVLDACKAFFAKEERAEIGQLTPMRVSLHNERSLRVAPVWVRHLAPERLVLLHLWLKPLTDRQVRAIKSILYRALAEAKSRHSLSEIDIYSIARSATAATRHFYRYDMRNYPPLSDEEMERFLNQLCAAWEEYRRRLTPLPREKLKPEPFRLT